MKVPTLCVSTTICQRDAPQNRSRLAKGTWQLLFLLLLLLLPLLMWGPGLMKFYAPLLGLQDAMENTASQCLLACLLGLCIAWCSSLQLGGGLTLTLTQKLHVQQALWQPLAFTQAWGFQLLTTLIRGACGSILRLLQWEAGLALLSVAQRAGYSLVSFHHENSEASEQLLQAVLQQVAVSLLVCCLDKLWVALGWVAQAMRCSGLQPLGRASLCWAASKDLDAVTTILPATTVPFSRRFPGPDPATLSRLTPAPINLCLVVGAKNTSKGKAGCRFGTTKVPISTRFQSTGTSKVAFRSSPKQAFARQVKVTCVLIMLLYICATLLFVQILK